MPYLYTDFTEKEIRTRFIQKCDDLIATSHATSYKDICERIQISQASFNQVKTGKAMPTLKMLYNLQTVYKVPAESILFAVAPKVGAEEINQLITNIHLELDQLKKMIAL